MSDIGASRLKSPAPSVRPMGTLANTNKGKVVQEDSDTDSDIDMTDAPAHKGATFGSKDDVKIEPFYGQEDDLIPFLTRLRVVFKLNPVKYKKAKTQVLYAAMQLKGAAQSWFQPILSDYIEMETPGAETAACFHSFAKFEEMIKQVFGTVNKARAASRKIFTVRQTTSAAAYFSEFQKIAKDLTWENDDAFKDFFYNGLKESIRKEMMEVPTTYKEMVEEAISIDNRLHELRYETQGPRYNNRGRGGYHNSHRKGYNNQRGYHFQPRRDYGDPMDLSNLNAGRASRTDGRGRGGRGGPRGNEREKERRRKENLCYTCGKSGHRARECQNSARGLHMMNIESDDANGSVEKKADTIDETRKPAEGQGKEAQKDRQGSDNPQRLGESDIEKLADDYWNEFWGNKPKKSKKKSQSRKEKFDELLGKEKALEAQYNARRKTAEHARASWHFCHEDDCKLHLASKTENKWFPHKNGGSMEPRDYYEEDGDQETLAMMAIGPHRYTEIVSETDTSIELWTNRWRRTGTRVVHDPEATPKAWLRVKLIKCRAEECPSKDELHSHTTATGEPVKLEIWKGACQNQQCPNKENDHPHHDLSMMTTGPGDDIMLNSEDVAMVRTHYWEHGHANHEGIWYNPTGQPKKDKITVMLRRCATLHCRDYSSKHTHSTITKEACRFPFGETTPDNSQESQWWMNEYVKTQQDEGTTKPLGLAGAPPSIQEMVKEIEDKVQEWLDDDLDERSKEGSEDDDYEVIVSKTHLMVFKTTRYQVSHVNGKEKLTFHPTGPKQEEARPVSIEGCYDRNCKAVVFYHSHDTVGGVVVKYDPLSQTIGGLPAKLISLDANEEEWEEVEPSDDESDDDSIISTGEAKLYVVKTTRHWIKIVTNYWEYKECEGCANSTGWHTHVVYNPDIEPQRMVNSINISFCTDHDCQQGQAIHAHPGSDGKEQIRLQVEAEEANRLWGTTKPTMRNLTPAVVPPEDIPKVDSRANTRHMYKHFTCAYDSCPRHYQPHQHMWNVSPDEPNRPIARGRYGMFKTCMDRACKNPYGGHVHSKNDNRMTR